MYIRKFKVKNRTYYQLVKSVKIGNKVRQKYIKYIPKRELSNYNLLKTFTKPRIDNINRIKSKLERIKSSETLTKEIKLDREIETRTQLDSGLNKLNLKENEKLKELQEINKFKRELKTLKKNNQNKLNNIISYKKKQQEIKLKKIELRKEYVRCFSLKREFKKYPKYHTQNLKLHYELIPNPNYFKKKELFNSAVLNKKVIYVPPLYKYPEKISKKYVNWFKRYRKDFMLHQKKRALPKTIGQNVYNNFITEKTKETYKKLFNIKVKIDIDKYFIRDYVKYINKKLKGKHKKFFRKLEYSGDLK